MGKTTYEPYQAKKGTSPIIFACTSDDQHVARIQPLIFPTDKDKLWYDLTTIISDHNSFSIVLGDFNEVRTASERLGSIFDSSGATRFNGFITNSGLCDLPLGGKRFTRMNRSGSKLSKIDRILVSKHIVDLWPNSHILALPREFSDHSPLLLTNSCVDFGPSPFKFYNSWLLHKDFPSIFLSSWLNSVGPSPKAKVRWALKGDENARFFHGIINNNRNRCRINGLNILGAWVTNPVSIKNHIFNSFESKFKEPNTSRHAFTSNLFKHLSCDEIQLLDQPFTSLEIKEAVWDCGGDKSPDPDGFTFKLIKKYWDSMSHDIISYVKHFDSFASIPKGCNSSFITLIPKSDDPLVIGDFRPISLIGCQYKIIAKILANRLALVIPSVVREVQMAFIKGHQIIDGPPMVDKIISWAKRKKKKLMFLKVDFEKAFDTLNWSFLMSVMEQMGFSSKWRNWIFSYLDSAYASVLVNGSPTSEFKFADDALIMGDWSLINAQNLFRILNCFHLASDLKVNFNKSKLYGIGVNNIEVNLLANTLGCQPFNFPCTDLGLPIGNALWCKLIRSIHGQSGDSNTTLPLKSKSGTWYHIVSIKNDLLNLGIDMSLIFKKKIGNGSDTRFWTDNWVGGGLLKFSFLRLYRLDTNKQCVVSDRAPTFHQHFATTSAPIATASQVGLVYKWSWIRRIRAGPDLAELEDHCSLVAHLRLSLNQDIWECTIDDSRTFTVKGMQSHITHLSTNTSLIPIRWNSILPSKVNFLTWRIVNLRLPARVNLDYRGIDLDSIRCPICDAAIETENHLFTECDLSKSTWNHVPEWWGIQNTNITNINDIMSLVYRVHLPASTVKIFYSVVTMWVLWQFRNEATFAIKRPNKDLIINDIKSLSFNWYSSRKKNLI
ncbi:RNA-directed DNA polymerase, eukaryota [Tanacetum coccineum]|uniref:RNA-directed DNA polymerase, eukaryota n=1 Tax=Tanacetum coccineum TaxID=301880 RepID=A0ABQ5JCD3_9ASTR